MICMAGLVLKHCHLIRNVEINKAIEGVLPNVALYGNTVHETSSVSTVLIIFTVFAISAASAIYTFLAVYAAQAIKDTEAILRALQAPGDSDCHVAVFISIPDVPVRMHKASYRPCRSRTGA